MNAAHHLERPLPVRRWYAPDYRRQLRDAGAFRTLSASAQVVHSALCDRANAAGVAWPAVETIARDYGLAESTVRRVLGELDQAGLVLVARRAGRVSRYVLVMPQGLRGAYPTPPESGGDPSQIETPPLSIPAPIMTMDHLNDHEKQHDSADPDAEVVVEDEASTGGHVAASPRPNLLRDEDVPITMLEPDVVERARALELAPAKLNRYGSARVRDVLDALITERDRRSIANPAGWVMQALRENWTLSGAACPPGRAEGPAIAEAVAPPEGTCWARPAGGDAVAILDLTNERVKLMDGSVIPRHHWARWEWLTERPDEAAGAGDIQEPDQGLVREDAAIAPETRAVLARLTAWAAIRPRATAELAAKLQASGATLDEWEVYCAAQARLAANP